MFKVEIITEVKATYSFDTEKEALDTVRKNLWRINDYVKEENNGIWAWIGEKGRIFMEVDINE